MASLDALKPKVKILAGRLVEAAKQNGCPIVVTQTLRTLAEQDALYAQGRTAPGRIVTNAKGGFSFHNFGVAFDICPVIGGILAWNDFELFKKIGVLGLNLGLEWGGLWASFPDLPHFQYTAGYPLAAFRANQVNWKRFQADENALEKVPVPFMRVIAHGGLNVRAGPALAHAKIGAIAYGATVAPLEKKEGWMKISYQNGVGWISENYLEASL